MKAIQIIFLTILLTLTACSENNTKKTVDKKTLIMGVTADYPPFEFIKNKKIVGFDVDLGNEIVSLLGYKLYIKEMDFDALIPALHAGRIDFILSGFSTTPQRKKSVEFSIPYYSPSLAILYKKDTTLKDVSGLSGKKVAVQLGSVMENYIKEKSKDIPKIDIISLTRNPTMVQELKIGRVDAVMIEEAQAKTFAKKYKNLEYFIVPNDEEERVAVAFSKGSELIEKFNEAIIQLRDSGKLDKLREKWIH